MQALQPDLARGEAAPSRRSLFKLFGGAAAAAATVAVSAGSSRSIAQTAAPVPADAELLALHQRFLTHDAAIDAWNAGEIAEKEGEVLELWWDCINEMWEWTPDTPAGVAAMADTAWRCVEKCGSRGGSGDDFARHVLSGIALWGGLARPPAVAVAGEPAASATSTAVAEPPDADLIARCNNLVAAERAYQTFVAGLPHNVDVDPDIDPDAAAVLDALEKAIDGVNDGGKIRSFGGLIAMAQVVVVSAPRRSDGTADINGSYEEWAMEIADYLAAIGGMA